MIEAISFVATHDSLSIYSFPFKDILLLLTIYILFYGTGKVGFN